MALLPEAKYNGIDSYVDSVSKLGSWLAGTTSAELPRKEWPLMVRFRDVNDPTSVERVDPDTLGVKRVLLETTSEDVTMGIEKRLRWLREAWRSLDHRGGIDFSGNTSFAKQIKHGDFSTELPK